MLIKCNIEGKHQRFGEVRLWGGDMEDGDNVEDLGRCSGGIFLFGLLHNFTSIAAFNHAI